MKKLIDKKEFEKEFTPFNESGSQIWVITRVKKLPIEIINMAIRLANLEFINFVRICDELYLLQVRITLKDQKFQLQI